MANHNRVISFYSTSIRHFLAVAQTGSVSQAADRLHVAGSAVSRQIGKLEEALGCALFERHARGMVPTPAGERLMAHVRAGEDDAARVLEQLQGLAGQMACRVRLACTEGFAAGFMPAVVAGFREAHPEAVIELAVGSPEDVRRQLLQGEADLALKYSVAPEPGLVVRHAATAPVYALMRPTHPLARAPRVTVAQVAQHPIALSAPGMTGRQMFDLLCSLQGVVCRPSLVSNFSSALLPGVCGNDIVLSGYLTAAHRVQDGQLVAVPFAEPQMQQRLLQVLTLQGRSLSPLVQAFVDRLIACILRAGNGRAPADFAPVAGPT